MRTSSRFTGVLLLLLGACAPRSPDTVTLLVAASLADVVTELVTEYQRDADAIVQISSGASGALCAQIEWGAPCDLFLSADPHLIERLEATRRVRPSDTRTMAHNRLVVATSAAEVFSGDWPTALLSPSVRRIAIADPEAAPAGRYAQEALSSLGLWEQLRPKLVRAGDARAAAHLLALRTVQAAIVYKTDADADDSIMPVMMFDEASHEPIEYVGAILGSGLPENGGIGEPRILRVRALLDFLVSERAAPVWRKHGFRPVTASRD